jgi:phosphomannomutase
MKVIWLVYMNVDTSIFKAYDIRGIYPSQINEEVAEKTARAYARLILEENPGKKLTVVVGRDMRLSSPSLSEAVIKGLTESGVNVVDTGLVSTPTFYFAVAFYGYDGGLQVSASHNPKEYNGLKVTRKAAIPVSLESGLDKMRDWVVEDNFENTAEKGIITVKKNILEDVVKEESKGIDISSIKPLNIVVDAANSMGALDIEAIFENLPVKLIKINFDLDGTFPNHAPDPLVEENLKQLQEAVIKYHADLGIAPDGDGDRYFVVDEKGENIRQEILRGIMARISLEENPGATVAYDIRPGRITKDMIEEAGGKAIVTRVGHSLIKEAMLKNNAVFGGESSGHYFYKFPYGTFEAPTSLILRFLNFISKENKPLSEIVKPLKRYYHSGEINSKVTDSKVKLEELKSRFSDAKINDLDGITFEYPDYWFNVRPSNTEPLLRLNLEAKTKELMEARRDEVVEFIRA